MCDFRLTASGDHVQVAYPSNTGTYASFYRADYLGWLRSDSPAGRVTADDLSGGGYRPVTLRLRMSHVAPGAGYRPGDACTGQPETRAMSARLAVLHRPNR